MVKTNIQTFTGEVEILSNLHVGPSGSSYLTANGAASNVLDITGNVGATFFVGDGGFLSNIATTLSDIVNQGNVSANVLQFNSTSDYAGVGLVTSSNVGIQNTAPSHTLSIGDKIRVDDNTVETSGQSVIQVDGRILATRFQGDGGLLSNIATTFESIVNQGNVASNVVKFSSDSAYAGAGVITDSNVGIQNTAPTHNLSVGSNLHVNDTGSNVLTVHGNVVASNLNLGVFSITPAYGLNDVCNTSNGTSNVVQFQNATTSLVATSNITVGGNVTAQQLISTSNTEVGDRLKFSGSNVFVDTLRVADVAANIVTYDRATGELLDSSGTFMNKFAVVSEQPPSDLFANATTVTNHGGYTLTTSNLATNSNTYNAFDGTANAWTGGTGMYIGGSNVLIETNLTQLSNLHPTQFGDWLAIEFPYKTTLRHMKLTPATVWQSFPYAANLYATNNDLTWTEIKYWDGLNPGSASNVQTITVNATEQFKKYALVTTKLVPNTNIASAVALQDWQLFTESFSIDGGKVAMAQQAATGGETVMDQHGPHGRLPKAVPLKKYPEIVFESGKFDSNDSTNTYTQAGYTVTASDQNIGSSRYVWQLFDNLDGSVWGTSGGSFNSGQPGVASSTGDEITLADTTTHTRGHWAKIKFPNKIIISTYTLNSTSTDRRPASISILGSNDDTEWYIIKDVHAVGSQDEYSISVNATTAYKYIMFMVHSIVGSDNQMTIGDLKFYGYEEDPPTGDTSVDTTFTSIMNTPQTTGAQVYVDGSLGETFTNRVVGPTVSNTHTTYVSTEKYWELSGNVESNVTLEANTFLSGDAPHSLSMWFNSSNLVSNASNSCIFSLGTEERFDHIGAAFSNNYQTVQKLLSSDLEANDRFGFAVAMNSDGTKFIVGAYIKDDDVGNIADAGAAYIYTYNGSSWDEQKLMSPDIEASSHFGTSVAMSSDGTRVIVGAARDDEGATDTGAAYIYTYNGSSWDAGTKIVAPDKEQEDRFGFSVAMSGDGNRVIVGAYIEDHNVAGGVTLASAGSAYIYTYDGSSWDTGTKIVASDRAVSDIFGRSVAINSDGTKAIVGADGGEAAYIFTYNGSSWVQQQILVASDAAAGDEFGRSVAINSNGTKVIVGADGGEAAYIFTYNGSSWVQQQILVASDAAAGDKFGYSVAMNSDGTKVIVGAYLEHAGDITDTGAAYIFAYDGSNWDTGLKITAPDKEASDQFGAGTSVAMSGDGARVVVGANLDDVFSANSGTVYIYTRDTTHHLMTDLKLQSNTWHNLTYAYQGEGGSRVTYLDGRKVAEDQAEDTFGDYPPFAMTGYSQGGYVVSSNYENSNSARQSWCAFDETSARWQVDTGYSASSPFLAIAVNGLLPSITDTNGTPHVGHWLKLELPFKIKLDRFKTTNYINSQYQLKSYVILGSNDDVNWTLVHTELDADMPNSLASGTEEATISGVGYFKYLKMLVKSKLNGVNQTLMVQEVSYYGHRENDLVRLPDPTNVLKYPHIAMTGPAQRGYVVSASSEHSSSTFDGYNGIQEGKLFDDDPATFWHAETNGTEDHRYDGTDSAYGPGSVSNFDPTGINIKGEWLNLELPHKLKISKVHIRARSGAEHQAPKDFAFYGSQTNAAGSWTLIQSFTGEAPQDDGTSFYTITSNPTHYKYILMLITKLVGSTAGSVAQLQYYGTEEATSIPLQIGGGNIDKVANFRVYDKFVGEDQALEIWDAQKDEFGRAKSSMTLQKGRLGIGTTEPEGRLAVLDEPHNLEEFPPRAMQGDTVNFEEYGTFKASASSKGGGGQLPHFAFDKGVKILDTDTNSNNHDVSAAYPKTGWISTGSTYTNSTGLATSTASTRFGYSGEWLQLEMPFKINLKSFTLRSSGHSFGEVSGTVNQTINRCPKNFALWGYDGTSWEEIQEYTITATKTSQTFRFNMSPTTKYYGAFAIVIKSTNSPAGGAGSGSSVTTVGELRFFGTREQGQSVLHDGQLTLTKNLTVPRIGPALDADDTPRRDRLVVEYNTSTNPTFDGAVRDTSGRGNDGVFVGTASYDASQKAFEFSGTDPAIHRIEGLGYSLKGNQQLSASFWARVDVSSQDQGFFSVGDSGGVLGKCFSFRIDVGSSNYNLEVSYSGSAHTSLYRYQVSPLATVTGGIWRHFVAINAAGTKTANGTTYDHGATSAIRLFLDGVELFTMSSSTYANGVVGSASDVLDLDPNPTLSIGSVFNGVYDMHGRISNFKLYDIALTASEVKTLYNMGRCDEGGHMVNFSKTRVGIGLGDGEAPMGDLDVRGPVVLGPGTLPEDYWFKPTLTIFETFRATASARPGGGIQFCQHDSPGQGWMMGVDTDVVSSANGCELVWEFHNNGSRTGRGAQLSAGPNITSINFTGQHRTFIKDVPFSQVGDLEGLVVSSDQNKYIKMSGGIEAGSNAITTNESLPIVSLSNVVTDKKCFGVISASENPEQRSDAYGIFKSFYPKEKGDTRVYINSVGEGAIWVSNIGGNLEAGDYITTSNIAGYGQKQESDSLKNYTVAKITMDCDFNPATQPIQQILRSNVIQTYYLGDVHKVKTVPHEFVTTVVGANDTWSNVSIKPSDVTYAEWSNLEANTQNTYNLTYTQTSNVVYDTKYTLTTTANVTESDPWDSVFVDPPSVTYAEYSNLEANTQSSYSLTFTKTTTDEKTPEEWSALESNTQSLYNMIYYQSVEEEVASDYPGATTHTRVTDVIENELDAHGQIQWEDHATETEKAYKIRYLDVSGAQTDSANAVHIAAFVGCTYHCG